MLEIILTVVRGIPTFTFVLFFRIVCKYDSKIFFLL